VFTSLTDKKIVDKKTERDTGNEYNMRLDVVGGAARSGQTRLGLKPCLPHGAHFGLFSQCAWLSSRPGEAKMLGMQIWIFKEFMSRTKGRAAMINSRCPGEHPLHHGEALGHHGEAPQCRDEPPW
jgi:hypothetical protein